jgi:hypothetical protein
LYGDERGRRQFLLPSAQNAAIDPVAAGYLSGARSVLPRLIENLVFVRLSESSPMTFTWSRNNRTRR